jgi:predicted transcriptional regulator of viral defense system
VAKPSRETDAREAFRKAGGILRTSQALKAGIHPRDLYALREAGIVEKLSRGVHRLTELSALAEPDLAIVAARVPKAIIAVVSALQFHKLGAEIPHEVSIALPKGASRPRLEWPPLRVYWFSAPMYAAGIEVHKRDGVSLRVYGAAKTVADCFKFRNRLGIEVAVDALRTGLEERKFTPAEVLSAARTCRVARIVRPYLEALQ